jgi:hypothetical protein
VCKPGPVECAVLDALVSEADKHEHPPRGLARAFDFGGQAPQDRGWSQLGWSHRPGALAAKATDSTGLARTCLLPCRPDLLANHGMGRSAPFRSAVAWILWSCPYERNSPCEVRQHGIERRWSRGGINFVDFLRTGPTMQQAARWALVDTDDFFTLPCGFIRRLERQPTPAGSCVGKSPPLVPYQTNRSHGTRQQANEPFLLIQQPNNDEPSIN